MSLSIYELGEMTPRTLTNKIRGQREKDAERLAIERRFTTFIANAFGGKLKPKDILSIPEYDSVAPKDNLTYEERQRIAREELKKLEKTDGK